MSRQKPNEIYATNRPRKGEQVTYKGALIGKVYSIDGNLCNIERPNGTYDLFIWCFYDGLNKLHNWPSKEQA